MNKKNKNKQGGQIIILNTLFFLSISIIIILGIAGPVLGTYSFSQSFLKSKESFLVANSASEEALYRLKTGKILSSSEVLTLAGGTATINVGDDGDNKIISIDSDVDSYQRSLDVKVSKGVGTSFNYGLQSGKGGFVMDGGATINGNVYANGDIVGNGGPIITGSAVVANVSDPTSNISNSGPEIPINSINFGGDATPQDLAQSFQVSTSTPISSIRIYIKKSNNNWMNNITFRITTDNGGKPSKTTLASGVISATQVTTSYNYLTIPFTSQPSLTSGTKYWMVFDTATTWGSYYTLGANNNIYANHTTKKGTWSSSNGGTWSDNSPNTMDIYFDVYVGGDTGLITGINVGSSGGDAWAHEVNNSTVSGTIYCQAATGNNKSCDTSRPDPVEQPFPISDGNILEWKSVAEAGGVYNGDLSYGSNTTVSKGPLKINGNLSLNAGAILNITGTLWVTGNIDVSGGAKIKLGSNYANESGVLVSDGRISMTGGGTLEGTGQAGSYILAVTTSGCPDIGSCSNNPAIKVTGGTGSVVLNAQKGTIEFSGGASAKQATANKITMSGGTVVNYETGLADIKFKSGPSGSWNLILWDEVE